MTSITQTTKFKLKPLLKDLPAHLAPAPLTYPSLDNIDTLQISYNISSSPQSTEPFINASETNSISKSGHTAESAASVEGAGPHTPPTLVSTAFIIMLVASPTMAFKISSPNYTIAGIQEDANYW